MCISNSPGCMLKPTHAHTCMVRGCAKKNPPHISTLAYPLTSPVCLLTLYLARNQGAVTQADGSRALQDSVTVRCGSGSAADTGLKVQEIPADSGAGILACASAIGKADGVGRGDCNCLESVGKRKRVRDRENRPHAIFKGCLGLLLSACHTLSALAWTSG